MNSVSHNNATSNGGLLRPTIPRNCMFTIVRLALTERCKQTLALSLLSVFLLQSWPAIGAEGTDDGDQSDAFMKQTNLAKQELMNKIESMKSMRIVMHAQEPTEKLADNLQSLLNVMGAVYVEKRIVDNVPNSNQVRYYHPADEEAGQVVQEALSPVLGDVALRYFEDYQPVPADGLIEIWLR